MRSSAATEATSRPCTAFVGQRLLLAGPLKEVALAVKAAAQRDTAEPILVFDDASGRVIDLDLRGSNADIIARLPQTLIDSRALAPSQPAETSDLPDAPTEKRGRGRPRLGVVPREITLLPRHWDWLAAQPGGASVTLRRRGDEARRAGATSQEMREAREAAYRFMASMAGNLPSFEEATRALFASDASRFAAHTAAWPQAIADYARKLVAQAFAPGVKHDDR
jgi:hypothetical protein